MNKGPVVAGSAADFLWDPSDAVPGLGEPFRLSSEFGGLPSGLTASHPSVCSGFSMPPSSNMGPVRDYLQTQLVDPLLHVGYGVSQGLIPPPQRNLRNLTPYLDNFNLGVSHYFPAARRPLKLEASRVFAFPRLPLLWKLHAAAGYVFRGDSVLVG